MKKVILTDLVKNVKNGVFLTKCQKSGNGGFDRSATVLYRVKKSRSAVFGHIWLYRWSFSVIILINQDIFLDVEDRSAKKSEE